VGKKKAPVYRIVVMPKHRDPWANNTEILGHYNPRKTPKEVVVNADRVKYWLEKGAQASDSVWNLLVSEGIIEGKKRGVTTLSKKRKGKMDEKDAAKKEKAEAAKVKAQEEAEAAKAKAAEEAAAPAEEVKEEKAEEAVEEKVEEKKEEAPAEEKAEETKE
jgi:small subunit ribosomal protein S16